MDILADTKAARVAVFMPGCTLSIKIYWGQVPAWRTSVSRIQRISTTRPASRRFSVQATAITSAELRGSKSIRSFYTRSEAHTVKHGIGERASMESAESGWARLLSVMDARDWGQVCSALHRRVRIVCRGKMSFFPGFVCRAPIEPEAAAKPRRAGKK
jgi:hypothetical protein